MADHYRKILSDETAYLSEHIAKYSKILEDNAEQLTESVVGQLHLAIGQSNLFINERFKQFSGLIDDCELKRGEMEIKVDDLAGFWDMIYYQVEDLKTKYTHLETLEKNKWAPLEPTTEQTAKSLDPVILDNRANIIKNKRTVASKTNGHLKNCANENGITTTDGAVKKPVARSNIREFLKNKRKEAATGTTNGVANGTNDSIATNEVTINGALSNGTHHHLNGHNKEVHNGTTNGHLNGSSLESQKLKALTETMSRHSLTTGLMDDTNKEN